MNYNVILDVLTKKIETNKAGVLEALEKTANECLLRVVANIKPLAETEKWLQSDKPLLSGLDYVLAAWAILELVLEARQGGVSNEELAKAAALLLSRCV